MMRNALRLVAASGFAALGLALAATAAGATFAATAIEYGLIAALDLVTPPAASGGS